MLKESELQIACVREFKRFYPQFENVLIKVTNEGKRSVIWVKDRQTGALKQVCVGGARAKAEGMVKGVADLLLLVPRHGYGCLAIEMKRETYSVGKNGKLKVERSYQEPEQKAWQKCCEEAGNKYVVCRSVAEFMLAVNNYLRKQ